MSPDPSPKKSAVATSPCPNCGSLLGLIPQLQGHRIRCTSCRTVLAVTTASAGSGSQQGSLTCRLVGLEQRCPSCANSLFLIPELDGQRIRCRTCQGVFSVSVRPWMLSQVQPASKPIQKDEAASTLLPESRDLRKPNLSPEAPLRDTPQEGSQTPKRPSERVQEETTASNHHAQSEPTDLSAALGFLLISAALLTIVGLGVGIWWLFSSGSPPHPQARYLPSDCGTFVSLNWQEVARSGFDPASKDLPDLKLTRRCNVFLKNAELRSDDIERINAGEAIDGSGTIVVYWLKRPVHAADILAKPGLAMFKDSTKGSESSETIRGVPVYTYHDSALAFPEDRVIVNGEAVLVRKTLARRFKTFRDPLNQLMGTLDFSATTTGATNGVPSLLLSTHLSNCRELAVSIPGTTDCYQYGTTVCLVRQLYVGDAQATMAIQQCLQNSLAQTIRAPRVPTEVRSILKGVQLSASDGKIRLELAVPASQLSAQALDSLKSLFY